MAEGDIRIRTTHDGSQAEASIGRLQKAVGALEDKVSNKVTGALWSLFSIEKMVSFGRSVAKTIDDVGELIEKIKEGKKTIDEVSKESDLGKGHLGALAGIAEAGSERKSPWANAKAFAARFFYGVLGSALNKPVELLTPADDFEQFETRRAHALFGDLGTLDAAQAQGRLVKKRAERDKNTKYAIEQIVREELDDKGGGIPGRQSGGFSTMADYRLAIEKQQLEELKAIRRNLNPRASQLLDRKTMFE